MAVAELHAVELVSRNNVSMLPAGPGTYVLVLCSSTTRTVQIGRLGRLRLCPGYHLVQ